MGTLLHMTTQSARIQFQKIQIELYMLHRLPKQHTVVLFHILRTTFDTDDSALLVGFDL